MILKYSVISHKLYIVLSTTHDAYKTIQSKCIAGNKSIDWFVQAKKTLRTSSNQICLCFIFPFSLYLHFFLVTKFSKEYLQMYMK